MTTPQTDTKPNGPVAAAFVAAGIAALVLGIFVTLNEFSPDVSKFLKFDANFGIGKGVGPLSGKIGMAIIAYVISWVALHLMWRGKELNFARVLLVSLILVGLGFALTFPPIFKIAAPG
jgi:hypothetical protein